MLLRIISGVIAGILLLALIYIANTSIVTTVVLLCVLLAALEFNTLFFKVKNLVRELVFSVLCISFIILIKYKIEALPILIWSTFLVFGVIFVLNHKTDFSTTLSFFFTEIFGVLYIVSTFGFIIPVLLIPIHGKDFLLLAFMNIALSDSAAYFIGSRFGKHPLAPKISPHKTIEGSIASLITSTLTTFIWIYFIYKGEIKSIFITSMLLFSIVGNVLAQFGDLFESILKRTAGVKDSGFFLPGHGGILDRTDSFLFVMPFYYFYLQYLVLRLV